MRMSRFIALLLAVVALAVSGCARRPYVASPAAEPIIATPIAAAPLAMAPEDVPYTLDSGDRLRIVVFGQDGLSAIYAVGASGNVTMPLIGAVPARGMTPAGLSQAIAEKLRQGYIREPHVAVEIESYRPFFILGEVTTPGQYAYVPNMTVENAVAIAGGFTPRAERKKATLSRNVEGGVVRGPVPLIATVRPGDTIIVQERWF
jgi:polysaccharide export outer membrane protein